jgi:hypothetical protein
MRGRRAAGFVLLAVATVGAAVVQRRLPWIPSPYLAALVVVPVAGWRIVRARQLGSAWRALGAIVASATFAALLPVPWLQADLADPPGSAWRLDGRLEIDGEVIDPPGSWYWLTVGRPPIVAEVAWSWLTDESAPATMHGGRRAKRPSIVEPAAAAVGLMRAGRAVELRLLVEATDPQVDGLPSRAVLATLNGTALSTREVWEHVVADLRERNMFTTVAGDAYEFSGASLPFGRIDVIDVPTDALDVAVGGRFARSLPGAWYRDLSLGASHGLMVALMTYAHAAGEDLAGGRTIAGTGTIRSNGTVGPITGLRAKASAARHVGADVLLFPADLAGQLAGFDPGDMALVPVRTLDEAIDALRPERPGLTAGTGSATGP